MNDVAKQLDSFLKENYVGSYDIIKCFYQYTANGFFSDERPGMKAQKFRQLLGNEGFPPVGKEYYSNLINYCELDNPSALCRYSISVCVKEINKQLKQNGIVLIKETDGRKTYFKQSHFNLFVHLHKWKTDDQYCQKVIYGNQTEYRYSSKAIKEIIEEIISNPKSVKGFKVVSNTEAQI